MGMPTFGFVAGAAFWSLRCADGRSFAIMISPKSEETAMVFDCSALAQNTRGHVFKSFQTEQERSLSQTTSAALKLHSCPTRGKQRELTSAGGASDARVALLSSSSGHLCTGPQPDRRRDRIEPHGSHSAFIGEGAAVWRTIMAAIEELAGGGTGRRG